MAECILVIIELAAESVGILKTGHALTLTHLPLMRKPSLDWDTHTPLLLSNSPTSSVHLPQGKRVQRVGRTGVEGNKSRLSVLRSRSWGRIWVQTINASRKMMEGNTGSGVRKWDLTGKEANVGHQWAGYSCACGGSIPLGTLRYWVEHVFKLSHPRAQAAEVVPSTLSVIRGELCWRR